MSIIDEIAQKRLDASQANDALGLHTESVDAVKNGNMAVVEAIAHIATKEDVTSLTNSINALHENLVNGFNALIELGNNQPDIPALIKEMQTGILKVVSKLDSSESDDKQLLVLGDIKNVLGDLSAIKTVTPEQFKKSQSSIETAIKAIKVAPVVNVPKAVINVPEPKVTIQEKPIDFAPLQDTLRQYFDKEDTEETSEYDLSNYRAQDVFDDGDVQYMGFVNPSGEWYIIENQVKKNSMRYLFGTQDYEKHFANASEYEYKVINEAIHALST